MTASSILTQEEELKCRKAFAHFDRDGSGTVDIKELAAILDSIGQNCSEADLKLMIAEIDDDRSGEIEFKEFLHLAERQKTEHAARTDDTDLVEAFVALGGQPDKSGRVGLEKLRATVKEFELTIDLEGMLGDVDKEGTGAIDYAEFKALLEG